MSATGNKSVLLIVGGGIAAYKSLVLVRLLRKAGIGVRPILTRAGEAFVTPLSLGALAESKVHQALLSLTDEQDMGHIELSRSADLVVVAPATADLIAKAANGHADDLASTTLLATDKPVLMAPAMNVRMWLHPAVRRNRATLEADGVAFVGPDEGAMACGEFGPGRMAEPEAIFAAIMAMLEENVPATARPSTTIPPSPPESLTGPLTGKRALVTAGPTWEPIDPVRYIANRSSGRQGYAIAAALARLGADVTLVSGPTALPTPAGVTRIDVETAQQMLLACQSSLPVDMAVCVAAVADWRPEAAAHTKIKKTPGMVATLSLAENPDILAALCASGPRRPRLVVGFAAETNDLDANAKKKLAKKGCDLIVGNDVSEPGVMGGEDNAVILVSKKGVERWARAPKDDVAARLAARFAESLQ